jgi:hypothetical protein
MAFVPYMVGGYAVDKMMGGDGTKGALLGTGASFLPSMLSSGAALEGSTAAALEGATAAEGLATTGMGGMQNLGLTQAVPSGTMITGQPAFGQMMVEGISPYTPLGTPVGQSTGILGQQISNQAVNSSLTNVPSFVEQQLGNTFSDDGLNLLGKGKSAIDEGYADMSTSDKMTSGMGAMSVADNLATQPQKMISPSAPPIDRRNPNPTKGKPLVTQIQGLQKAAPSAMMGQLSPKEQEEYYSLLRSI